MKMAIFSETIHCWSKPYIKITSVFYNFEEQYEGQIISNEYLHIVYFEKNYSAQGMALVLMELNSLIWIKHVAFTFL